MRWLCAALGSRAPVGTWSNMRSKCSSGVTGNCAAKCQTLNHACNDCVVVDRADVCSEPKPCTQAVVVNAHAEMRGAERCAHARPGESGECSHQIVISQL